jgi:hypothetical protein
MPPDGTQNEKPSPSTCLGVKIFPMTNQEIRTLPAREKVRIMEAIWEDMRNSYEEAPISQEMLNLLKERQARVARGEARLLDWDKVKFALGRG